MNIIRIRSKMVQKIMLAGWLVFLISISCQSNKNDEPAQAVETVYALRKALDIPVLRSYNIENKKIPLLAKDALGRNSNCVTNPREVTEDDAKELYKRALR